MARIRVHALAKELGIDSRMLIAEAARHGIELNNHMATVPAECEATLRSSFLPAGSDPAVPAAEEPESQEGMELTLRERPDDLDLFDRYVATFGRESPQRVRNFLQLRCWELQDAVGPRWGFLRLALLLNDAPTAEWAGVEIFRRDPDHRGALELLGPEVGTRCQEVGVRYRALDGRLNALIEHHGEDEIPDEEWRLIGSIARDNPRYYRATKLYLRICGLRRDTHAALGFYEDMRRTEQSTPGLSYLAARALFECGAWPEASELAIRSLEVAPAVPGPDALIIRMIRNHAVRPSGLEQRVRRIRESSAHPEALDRILQALEAHAEKRVRNADPPAASPVAAPGGGVTAKTAAPNRPPSPDRLLTEARRYELEGDAELACRTYQTWATVVNSYDAYRLAAQVLEKLGELGRAEWLYGKALQARKDDETARQGMERVRRARSSGVRGEEPADLRESATRKLQTGDVAGALKAFLAWVEASADPASYLEAAQALESAGQVQSALHVIQLLLTRVPDHVGAQTAAQRLRDVSTRPKSVRLADVRRLLALGTPQEALQAARAFAEAQNDPPQLVLLVAMMRRRGVGADLEWLSESARGATFCRWIYGRTTLEELQDAPVDLRKFRIHGARLAASEHRWADARRLAEPLLETATDDTERLLVAWCRHLDDDSGQMAAALRTISELTEDVLERVELPEVRASKSAPTAVGMGVAERAFDAVQRGSLDEAAVSFALAAQVARSEGDTQKADEASFHEAVVRCHKGEWKEAKRILVTLRFGRQNDRAEVLWLSAVCFLKLAQHMDAENTLRTLLAREPEFRPAQGVTAALAVRRRDYQAALSLLAGGLVGSSEPTLLSLFLRVALDADLQDMVRRGIEVVSKRFSIDAGVESASSHPHDEVATLDPRRTRTIGELDRICFSLIDEGRAEVAVRFVESYVGQHSGDVPARQLRWRLRARLGEARQAAAALEEMARRSQGAKAIACFRFAAECHLLDDRPQEALDLLNRHILPGRSQDLEAQRLRKEALRRLQEGENDRGGLTGVLAETAGAGGGNGATCQGAMEAEAEEPGSEATPVRLNLKELRARADQIASQDGNEASLKFVRDYLRNHRGWIPGRMFLIERLVAAGHSEEAAQHFESVRNQPQDSFRLQNLRQYLMFLVDHGAARQALRLILSPLPADAVMDRRIADAVAAAAGLPMDADDRIRIAELLHRHQQSEAAQHVLGVAMQHDSRDDKIRAACARMAPALLQEYTVTPERLKRTVEQYRRTGRLEQVLPAVKRARSAATPSDPDYALIEAEVLEKLGRDEEAVTALRSVFGSVDDSGRSIARGGPVLSNSQVRIRRDVRLRLASSLGRLRRQAEELQEYAILLQEDPFDFEVHRRLASLRRNDLLPCVVSDTALLQECSRVFQSGRVQDQIMLTDRIQAAGGSMEVIGVVRTLVTLQPGVEYWHRLARSLGLEDAPRTALPSRPPPEPPVDPAPAPAGVAEAPLPSRRTLVAGRDGARHSRLRVWRDFIDGRRRTWWDVAGSLSPLAWRNFEASLGNRDPSRLDAGRELENLLRSGMTEARTSVEAERLMILVESVWTYRLWRHHVEERRRGRRLDRGHHSLSEEFRSEFLPDILAPAASVDADDAVAHVLEVVEVAREALDGPDRRALLEFQQLTEVVEGLREQKTLDHLLESLNRGFRLAERLCEPLALQNLPPRLRQEVMVLVRRWKEALSRRSEEARIAADLKLDIRVPRERTFQPEMAIDVVLRNEGTESARGVELSFDDCGGIRFSLKHAAPVREIQPRRQAIVRVVLSQLTDDMRAVELRGMLRFQATRTYGHTLRIAQVITPPWIQEREPLRPEENPYVTGPSLEPGEPSFVRRPELMGNIREALAGAQGRPGNNVLLHGLRRVGKTSLLKALREEVAGEFTVAYFDVETYQAGEYRTGDILFLLSASILEAARRVFQVPADLQPREAWRAAPTECFMDFLSGLRSAMAGQRLLLMIDEFETLLQKIIDKDVDRGLLGMLRSLMQHQRWISWVLVGAVRVRTMGRSHDTALFNQLWTVPVSFLSRNEARELICGPLRGRLDHAEQAVEALIDETAGHPYFLQVLCKSLFTHMRRERRHFVTSLDALQVIDGLVTAGDGDDQFEWVLRRLGLDPLQKLVLSVIADLTRYDPYCEAPSVVERLAELGFQSDDAGLDESAIYRLVDLNLIACRTRPDGSVEYRLAIPLIGKWLNRYCPPADLAERLASELLMQTEDAGPGKAPPDAEEAPPLPASSGDLAEEEPLVTPPDAECSPLGPPGNDPPATPVREARTESRALNAFCGRQDIIEEARSLFPPSGRRRGHLAIHGPKLMGKTFLLQQIRREIDSRIPGAVIVELGGNDVSRPGGGRFWIRCLDALSRHLGTGGDASPGDPEIRDRIREALKSPLLARRPVFLFLDDFHVYVRNREFDLDAYGWLRGIAEESAFNVALIVASRRPLEELWDEDLVASDLVGIFAREGRSFPLEPLDEKSSSDLCNRTAGARGVTLNASEFKLVFELCKGHPFLTARVTETLCAAPRTGGTRVPTPDEVVKRLCAQLDLMASELRRTIKAKPEIRTRLEGLVNVLFRDDELTPQSPAVRTLRDTGLFHWSERRRLEYGRVAFAYLCTSLGVSTVSAELATAEEVQTEAKSIKAFEGALRDYVEREMSEVFGPAWDRCNPPVDANLRARGDSQERVGESFIEKLTLGELFHLFKKVPGKEGKLTDLGIDLEVLDVLDRINEVRRRNAHHFSVTKEQLIRAKSARLRLFSLLGVQ